MVFPNLSSTCRNQGTSVQYSILSTKFTRSFQQKPVVPEIWQMRVAISSMATPIIAEFNVISYYYSFKFISPHSL